MKTLQQNNYFVCISTIFKFSFELISNFIPDVENNQTKWSVKDALLHDRVGEPTEALVSKVQDMKFGVIFDMDTN